jgi:hypothetical protein
MHIMAHHMGLNLFGWSIRPGRNFDQKCSDYIRQRPKIFSKSVPPSGFAAHNQGSYLSAPDVHLKTLHLEDSEICHPSKVWHFINICNYYVLLEGHWLCIAIIFIGIRIKIHTYPWLSQLRRVLSMISFWTQLDFIWVKSLHNFEFSFDI